MADQLTWLTFSEGEWCNYTADEWCIFIPEPIEAVVEVDTLQLNLSTIDPDVRLGTLLVLGGAVDDLVLDQLAPVVEEIRRPATHVPPIEVYADDATVVALVDTTPGIPVRADAPVVEVLGDVSSPIPVDIDGLEVVVTVESYDLPLIIDPRTATTASSDDDIVVVIDEDDLDGLGGGTVRIRGD